MDMTKNLRRETPRSVLAHFLENGVAKVVGKHSAKASTGICKDEARNDRKCRMRAHAVDGELQRVRSCKSDCLTREHKQDRGNYPAFQLGLPPWPQHWQESPKGGKASVGLVLLGRRGRHQRLRRNADRAEQTRCGYEGGTPLRIGGSFETLLGICHMGPGYFVIAILGCADGGTACTPVATLQTHYATRAECSAATSSALEENSNFDFPTLLARCRGASARTAEGRQDQVRASRLRRG